LLPQSYGIVPRRGRGGSDHFDSRYAARRQSDDRRRRTEREGQAMWHQSSPSRRSRGRVHRRFLRPRVEGLESRRLLATYTVINTNDAGVGSLRATIQSANNDTTLDTIAFAIPGSGVHTISPLSALPTITNPVVIDGYTQPGARPNTLANGDNA